MCARMRSVSRRAAENAVVAATGQAIKYKYLRVILNHSVGRARGGRAAVPIFEETLTEPIASCRHGVGSALVSRRLHRPWRCWRVGGLQWRHVFCRARAVAP